MNIHPLVIHFPIALLMLYGVLEFVRFGRALERPYLFYTKAILSIAGALGALASVLTGALASGWMIGGPRIFALHQLFGIITLLLSFAVANAYLWQWRLPNNKYSSFVLRPRTIVTLAILIIICVFITGGLGGAMARGTNFDPFMVPILKLLGVY